MKWLLMLVAFVVGAAMTWLLTVKRVTRTLDVAEVDAAAGAVPAVPDDMEDTVEAVNPVNGEGEGDSPDEASRFGGERTEASADPGPAERWDRDAEDVDALLSRSDASGVGEEGSPEGDPPDGEVPGPERR